MEIVGILLGIMFLGYLLGHLVFSCIPDYFTAMEIRKGLVSAKMEYDRKYKFRSRNGEINIDNQDGVLKFEQFKGRF